MTRFHAAAVLFAFGGLAVLPACTVTAARTSSAAPAATTMPAVATTSTAPAVTLLP